MKTRAKRSIIWSLTKDQLIDAISKSNTLTGVLRILNLSIKCGYSKILKKKLEFEGIDYSHIKLGVGHNLGKKIYKYRTPLEDMLTENSNFSRCQLKKRLLAENIILNKCYICGIPPIWNDKKLVMVLDHINGISNDNRLENLRMLCPNCNSQQETFSGKHNKISEELKKPRKNKCPHCEREKAVNSKSCFRCVRFSKTHIEKPTKEQLKTDLESMNFAKIGRKYNVSPTTIMRWSKMYEIYDNSIKIL